MRDRNLIGALLFGAAVLTACEPSDQQPEHPENTAVAPSTNATAPEPDQNSQSMPTGS